MDALYLIILFILIGPTHLVEDIPLILSPMDSGQLYPNFDNFPAFKNLKIITLKLRYSTAHFHLQEEAALELPLG